MFLTAMDNFKCPITSLRSFCRSNGINFHQRIVDETGLPHERWFHVQTILSNPLNILGDHTFDGFGHSIKSAKRSSAFSALTSLKQKNYSTDADKVMYI